MVVLTPQLDLDCIFECIDIQYYYNKWMRGCSILNKSDIWVIQRIQ